MTKTVEELSREVLELTAQIEPLKKDATAYKALMSQPNFSGAERLPQSGWEPSDEEITVVSGRDDLSGPTLHRRAGYKTAMKSLMAKGYKPKSEFKSLGEFLKFGMENRSSKTAIENRVGDHFGGKSVMKAIQGLTTTDGAEGGFTIMPEFSHKILERVFTNNLWNQTDQYTVSGNRMTFLASAETSRANGSRAGGMQGYWVGEGQTMTKSTPKMREVNIQLGKICIVVYLTKEIMDDTSYALEQRVVKQAADEFRFLQGDALVNGVGSGGIPLGLMNSPHMLTISKESGQDAATINTYNIQKMYSRLFAPNLNSAKWLIHQDTQPQLNTMTLGLGLGQVPVYQPPGNMSAAPYGTLMGRAVEPTEFNATLGTTGDVILTDMGQILTISKGGIEQQVSMHVEFLTDQLAMRFTLRCGGRPWENTPLTPYKGSNTQSSAVCLETRS